MRTLTWKDFQQFEPCYNPQDRYGEWSGTAIDLLNHHEILNHEKIWAITRPGILSDKTLRLLAVAWAREVQHLMKDERSVKALDVAEAYAHGNATKEKMEETREEAVWAATEAATKEAVWGARAAAWAVEAAMAAKAAEGTRAPTEAAWVAWVARVAWAAEAATWADEAEASTASVSNQVKISIEIIQKYEP